jgi:hypothetical protein
MDITTAAEMRALRVREKANHLPAEISAVKTSLMLQHRSRSRLARH